MAAWCVCLVEVMRIKVEGECAALIRGPSFFLSLSFSLTRSLPFFILSLSLLSDTSCDHFLFHFFLLLYSFSHSLSLCLSLSHTHTHILCLSVFLSLSLSHTHTHYISISIYPFLFLSLSLSHTHTHTHTHSQNVLLCFSCLTQHPLNNNSKTSLVQFRKEFIHKEHLLWVRGSILN